MNYELWHDKKIAIVTGGTRGIGLSIAQVLKQRGALVAVGARTVGQEVEQNVEQDAGRNPDEYMSLQDNGFLIGSLDVRSTESVENFVALVSNTFGAPDILVNCAGVSILQNVCGHSDNDWNALIDTNLNGPFKMIRSCMPLMMSSGWGRIVNIASTAATTAEPTHAAYCASKSGLLGLTRAVALEGADCGVTCTSVSPTWVETEMLRSSMEAMAFSSGRTIQEEIKAIETANPQNRLVQASEIAHIVSFICSDLSPALTMEDIQVNAGAFW